MKQESRQVHGYASAGRIGYESPVQALIECPFNSSVHGHAKACHIKIGDITMGKSTKFGVLVADTGNGLPKNRERFVGEVFNDDVDEKNVPLLENGRINNHVGMRAFASYIVARKVVALTRENGKEIRKYRPGQEAYGPLPVTKDERQLFRKWCGNHGFLILLTDINMAFEEELRSIGTDLSRRKYIGFHLGHHLRDFRAKKDRMALKINDLKVHPVDNLAREEVGRHLDLPKEATIVVDKSKDKKNPKTAVVQLNKEERKLYLEFCRVLHRFEEKVKLPYGTGMEIPATIAITDVPHADLSPAFREKYYSFSGGTKGTVVSTEFDGRIVDLKTLADIFGRSAGGHDLSARIEISIDPSKAYGLIVSDIKRSRSFYPEQILEYLRNHPGIKAALNEVKKRRDKAVRFLEILKRRALRLEEDRLKKEVSDPEKGSTIRAAFVSEPFTKEELEKAEESTYQKFLSTLEKSKNIKGSLQALSKIHMDAFEEAIRKCSPFTTKRAVKLFKDVHSKCLREHALISLGDSNKKKGAK